MTPKIVQSLYFLNLKFQAPSHLLWLYSPVSVRPGQKPKDMLSHDAAHILKEPLPNKTKDFCFTSSEDSDKHGHEPSVISLFCPNKESLSP